MFKAAELGRSLSKKDYEARLEPLRMELLELQRELRKANIPVVVVVSGVEGAGKSAVVNRLTEWLDTRGIRTHTFWDETDDERARPWWWRFWRVLPPRGCIGIMFGSWYTRPIIQRALGESDEANFLQELTRIARFEDTLTQDGALIVKFWFHLSQDGQAKRIKLANKLKKEKKERKEKKKDKKKEKNGKKKEAGKKEKNGKKKDKAKRGDWKISPLAKRFSKNYDEFVQVSEAALRATDSGGAPWHVIEAEDAFYRDLTAGELLRDALRQRLAAEGPSAPPVAVNPPAPPVSILDQVDLTQALESSDYKERLEELQERLFDLTWKAWKKKRSTVLLFEGWDAGGKGGTIRRATGAMDARLFRTIPIAAPSDEERAQHYLWRFWRHVPRDGYVRIYDRSWYGRVLVERVEGFARPDEWQRAYREINEFEAHLARHGVTVGKFWLHISKEEQLQRFEARQKTPRKQHKITDEDWRNREKWGAYTTAVDDMVSRTSTPECPWTLVAANDKRFARIQVLETICERLEANL